MDDAPNEHIEHAEHAEHAAHSRNPMMIVVSATIAILAVIAAMIGSLQETEGNASASAKNRSILMQDRATDTWALFQAQSIKRNQYEIAAVTSPANADAFRAKAQSYADEQTRSKDDAEHLEHERDEALEQGEHREHRNHILTAGLTLVHISIAIATLSILTGGRRWPWYTALLLSALGIATSAYAYLA